METDWTYLPEPARGIAVATETAVAAARDADPERYADATERLAAHHAEQVGIVAGETVRLLLEDRYSDGLTGDDLREVLTRCAHAATWYDDFDPAVATTLIAGALGVHEADGERLPLSASDMAGHAPLLIAVLAAAPPAKGETRHPLTVYLRAALAEIARTQTMD
ncbi:MAG TPA: hypothetical protein VGN37_22930 [Actinocatenispora sp.]